MENLIYHKYAILRISLIIRLNHSNHILIINSFFIMDKNVSTGNVIISHILDQKLEMVVDVCSLHGNIRSKKGQKMAKNEFSNNPDKELVNNNRYVLRNIILYIILF